MQKVTVRHGRLIGPRSFQLVCFALLPQNVRCSEDGQRSYVFHGCICEPSLLKTSKHFLFVSQMKSEFRMKSFKCVCVCDTLSQGAKEYSRGPEGSSYSSGQRSFL